MFATSTSTSVAKAPSAGGEQKKGKMGEEAAAADDTGEIEIEIPLGAAAAGGFQLETAVCSHGLFMMAPNRWDPLTQTLSRPLRLFLPDPDSDSVIVSVSQPSDDRLALLMRVHRTRALSGLQRDSLVRQVVRMLRLSEADERVAREFRRMAAGRMGRFGGRVFRSPTLFEDMVKCILLCNCQWSRTLSMARSLCELQLELQSQFKSGMVVDAACSNDKVGETALKDALAPRTPAGKDSKRKHRSDTSSSNCLTTVLVGTGANDELCKGCEQHQVFGNFPSPGELASLDEGFLAKRCNVGYRAGRIIKLAKGIVEGRILLEELEAIGDDACLSKYDQLVGQLRGIDGFGPFTSANVLMCMGFYHVIPTDSETIRHLKQVHGKVCTIQTVQKEVEVTYGEYAPLQFLAYWSEVWHFYEQRFGRLSELSCSGYALITASNMRDKRIHKSKNKKASKDVSPRVE